MFPDFKEKIEIEMLYCVHSRTSASLVSVKKKKKFIFLKVIFQNKKALGYLDQNAGIELTLVLKIFKGHNE